MPVEDSRGTLFRGFQLLGKTLIWTFVLSLASPSDETYLEKRKGYGCLLTV